MQLYKVLAIETEAAGFLIPIEEQYINDSNRLQYMYPIRNSY